MHSQHQDIFSEQWGGKTFRDMSKLLDMNDQLVLVETKKKKIEVF